MIAKLLKCYILWMCNLSCLCIQEGNPIVRTKLGEIKGISSFVPYGANTSEVYKFLGIPYAQPPVNELRFKKPVPITHLHSPYDASKHPHICPQILPSKDIGMGEESEDCLYLNIYVPANSSYRGHAVMIFLHGGSFVAGSGNKYDGSLLAIHGNVIFVSVNYRLGVLGFLSTMDDNCPGNFGLWDQHMAFKWVHENIKAFGGDPERVTVFGQSAGSVATVIHAMTPINKGLFHRIIAQSGVVSLPLLNLGRNALDLTLSIAKVVECDNKGNALGEIVNCMRKLPWHDLIEAVFRLFRGGKFTNHLLTLDPVIDGDFIKRDLRVMSGKLEDTSEELEMFRSIPLMNGITEYEGGIFVRFLTQEHHNFQPSMNDCIRLIPTITSITFNQTCTDGVNKFIANEYIKQNSYEHIRTGLVSIGGDIAFGVPAIQTSRLHAFIPNKTLEVTVSSNETTNSETLYTKTLLRSYFTNERVRGHEYVMLQSQVYTTYMYIFKPSPTYRAEGTPTWLPGANHEEELQFLFGFPSAVVKVWEARLSKTMIKYWTNFAKTGNPSLISVNPDLFDRKVPYWIPYSIKYQHYMEFDELTASTKQFLLANKTHFWEQVFPVRIKSDLGSCSNGVVSGSNTYGYSYMRLSFSSFVALYLLCLLVNTHINEL